MNRDAMSRGDNDNIEAAQWTDLERRNAKLEVKNKPTQEQHVNVWIYEGRRKKKRSERHLEDPEDISG